LKIFDFPNFSAGQPESIDMLIVKIGRTVEKLFKEGFFHENSPLAPIEWNFDVFVLFPLLR
jgi:hypothetical protein